MSEQQPLEQWGTRLTQIARAFPYPPTPRLAARRQSVPQVYRSGLAWAAVISLLVIAGLAITPARIKLIEALGWGAGGSWSEPTPTLVMPTMTITGLPSPTSKLLTATPQPASTPLSVPTVQSVAELVVYAPALPPQSTRALP